MNETHKRMITELAKSYTEETYKKHLQVIRAINEQWAEWLDERKSEYVCYTFLARNIHRWGKVTSNAVETINGVLGEARSLPIVYLIEHLIQCQRVKYLERSVQASKWSEQGKRLTEYARRINAHVAKEASKRRVEIIEQNHPIYCARVQSTFNAPIVGYLEVMVDVSRHSSKCPCQYTDEVGISCAHIKALLLALNKTAGIRSLRTKQATTLEYLVWLSQVS